MLEHVQAFDERLFLFLNQFHSPTLDPVMLLITRTEFWIPLFAYLLYLIFKVHGKSGWFALAGITITIILADQITSGLMKPYFERLRPSHEPTLEGIVHLVDGYRGGLYGFASGHAANTFGVALFVFLLLRRSFRFAWIIFLWAGVMSYSRIYLGVHYPGDVVVGMSIGLGFGFASFRVYQEAKNAWLRKRAQANRE
ncbi:MAG: phosphatase PAP2 family protein [Cytophagales bacterium]|nr:phosphatase PAP2 family protein [Cytophagales bacterium]